MLAIIGAASAQDAPANAPAEGEVIELEPVTVLATKTEEKVTDVPASVSVATKEDIERTAKRRVDDVFTAMPGVDAVEARGNDPASAINIRGLQNFGRVAVVVDGARQNYVRYGHNAAGTFYLNPAFVSEVGVVRGPVANIYGSGAIGGVVAFDTIGIDDVLLPSQIAGGIIDASIGSNQEQFEGSGFFGLRAGQNADFVVGGVAETSEDYKDGDGNPVVNSGRDEGGGLFKARFRPYEGHELTLSGLAQQFNYTQANATGTANREDHTLDTQTYTAKYTIKPEDNDWIDLAASTYYTSTEDAFFRVQGGPFFFPPFFLEPPGSSASVKLETYGFDVNNSSRFTFADIDHTLTYGVDGFRDEGVSIDPQGGSDVYTPGGRRDVFGGFVQWMGETRWIDVIGAVRYDSYELIGGGVDNSGSRVSPKATVAVKPFDGVKVYGSYAEGYRSPTLVETLVAGPHPVPFAPFTFVPNPNLDPEIGKTLEAGVNLSFDDVLRDGDKLRARAAIFHNDVEDYIDTVTYGPPTPPFLSYSFVSFENVSEARIEGIELEATYDAGFVFAGVAASRIRGDNLTDDLPLNTIQPDKLVTTLGFRLLDERLTFGTRVAFVAAQDRVASAGFESDAYTKVDLFASYKITEDATAYVNVDNLLDETYRQYSGDSVSLDNAPGLTAKAGLKMRFGIE